VPRDTIGTLRNVSISVLCDNLLAVRWLVFGSYDVSRHPRVGVLVQGLRAAGDQVEELNVPLSVDTAARVAALRQPWRLPLVAGKLARCWLLLALRSRRHRRAIRRGSAEAVHGVLVGYLGHFDVHLARWLFRGTPIVLDHLVSAAGTARDRHLVERGGLRDRLLRIVDDAALRQADIAVVDTEENLASLPAHARDRGVVVPVGAGTEWFAAGGRANLAAAGGVTSTGGDGAAGKDGGTTWDGAPHAAPGRLRVVFVGLYTPLHGTVTVGTALALLADDPRIEVTMVGTGQDLPACRRAAAGNPRVTWYSWIPAAELPRCVASHHVALGIFGDTDKALRVVPTKVFQGAAAGCAVVTSDTVPQRRALGDAAVFVPPGDPETLAAALRGLADDPDRVARLRAAARRRAAERFAPVTVVAPLRHRLAAVVALPGRRAAVVGTPVRHRTGGRIFTGGEASSGSVATPRDTADAMPTTGVERRLSDG